MNEKEILNIIMNEREVSNKELNKFLQYLLEYSHFNNDKYEDEIFKILIFISDNYIENFEIYNTKDINDKDIKNMVGVLPNYILAKFLFLIDSLTQYIIIDYEAPDYVEGFGDLINVYEYSAFDIVNQLKKEDVKKIIDFIKVIL